METSVTKKGQTTIPAAIRKRHHIKEGDRLVWLDDGEVIRVVPVSADPITALRGSGGGEKLLERLLQNRRGPGTGRMGELIGEGAGRCLRGNRTRVLARACQEAEPRL
jgi:AbrB family looped-hinge helix DNA binding protein